MLLGVRPAGAGNVHRRDALSGRCQRVRRRRQRGRKRGARVGSAVGHRRRVQHRR